MAKTKREWSPNFLEYMEKIVSNENYKGLPIERKKDGSLKWVTTKNTIVGKKRIKWCEDKARELGYEINPGVYAKVMRKIHPTKVKVCQTCGRAMSIYYCYPNSNMVNSLYKEFGYECDDCTDINDIWDDLISLGIKNDTIVDFFAKKVGINKTKIGYKKEDVICEIEKVCREEGKKYFGPGAMSNFPDRYDGFHTYNRCCRKVQDKGRHSENMKSYTKDRRAYEYWSDGNIHAANQFMGSQYFSGTSADHIGPVSLGFIHDPNYLKKMTSSDNSSKNNKLQKEDIDLILDIYKKTNVYPMSWQSAKIWDYIVYNYKANPNKIGNEYKQALQQNMVNYMFILWKILVESNNGQKFLEDMLLTPKYECFKYSYEFDDVTGKLIKKSPRHFTERNQFELNRLKRIAITSVYNFISKGNRNVKPYITEAEEADIDRICHSIEDTKNFKTALSAFQKLMIKIQERIINSI